MYKLTFKTNKSEISITDEKIEIRDKEKKLIQYVIISSICWIIFGITSIIRFSKTGDQFLLWTGMGIGIVNSVIIALVLLRTSKSEILKTDIKSIVFKQRMGNKFIDIKLMDNKIRRINQIDEIYEDVRKQLETNYQTNN